MPEGLQVDRLPRCPPHPSPRPLTREAHDPVPDLGVVGAAAQVAEEVEALGARGRESSVGAGVPPQSVAATPHAAGRGGGTADVGRANRPEASRP